jgi:exosortase/archaeosortase family protein
VPSTLNPQPREGPVVSSQWSVVLPLAAFAILWADLIRQLSYEWSTSEQYAYGWFVPLFALGLFLKKWPSRPLPGLQDHGTTGQQVSGQWSVVSGPLSSGLVVPWSRSPVVPFLLSAFCFLLLLFLLPLRVIYEINQDWPLIAWPYTLIVVALTLYALHLAGPPSSVLCRPPSGPVVPGPRSLVLGPSSPPSPGPWSLVRGPWSFVSPWVRHFAFPVCFILVAVRWPWRIEAPLTQGLMRLDANITVEILGWLNIPAMQRGNLIELATGTVGVNEACSGIRSFQSSLMAALLMGELYRLRLWARAGLVGFGLLLAFGFNVVRTLILAWQANAHGLSVIDKWHDPAGLTITVACFLCLWAVAVFITKWFAGEKAESRKQKAEKAEAQPDKPQVSGSTPHPSDASQPSTPDLQVSGLIPHPCFGFKFHPSARRYLLAVGLWSLFCIAATQVWYRAHEAKAPDFVHWSVTLPETKPTFQKIELPPRTLELLKYDLGAAAAWQEEEGSNWSVYFFRWQGKSIQSIMAARYHRPEVCLPASGLQQISGSQADHFAAAGLKLPFRKSTYSAPGQVLYVFYCIWQDGDERRIGMRSRGSGDRLLGPIEGRRRFGQQVLEIITSGYASAAEAERAVRQRLPDLIRLEGRAVPATSPTGH